jgi:hypothetical protein
MPRRRASTRKSICAARASGPRVARGLLAIGLALVADCAAPVGVRRIGERAVQAGGEHPLVDNSQCLPTNAAGPMMNCLVVMPGKSFLLGGDICHPSSGEGTGLHDP